MIFIIFHINCVGLKCSWPDLPLLILDENEKTLYERVYRAELTADGWKRLPVTSELSNIDEVVLLPQVYNYHWHEKYHKLAIADPIVYRLGEAPLSNVLSELNHGSQQVDSCIVLAIGYSPFYLATRFYKANQYNGKEYMFTHLAKLPAREAFEVNNSIVRELTNGKVRVGHQIVSFKDAATSGSILSAALMETPVFKNKKRNLEIGCALYDRALFWGRTPEEGVAVCVSGKNINNLTRLLGCDRENKLSWPPMSFWIIEENKVVISQRLHSFKPVAIDKVILLPQVKNYRFHGKLHKLALAGPIVCKPGEIPLSTLLSVFSKGRQQVRRCIVLSRGYSPGGLFPLFYHTGSYDGRKNIIIDLPKFSNNEVVAAGKAIIRELQKKEIRIGPPAKVKDAVVSGSIISPCWLESSTVKKRTRWGTPRSTRISLWDGYLEGSSVPVCINGKGKKVIKDLLGCR